MVTSLVFGGSDLMDLYVVTADNTDDKSLKGTIFRGRQMSRDYRCRRRASKRH
jgi:sugar lactone lactonase YvrE